MTPEMKKLLVAPIMGGMFVIFMPAVVWVLIAQALWVHLSPKLKLAFRPAPVTLGVAYLAGQPEAGTKENKKLDELADEIASKR
jgi:hypothetical protein